MNGGRFDGHDPAAGHDTAGVPWAGRTLSSTGFDGDTGLAEPGLLRALRDPGDGTALMASLAQARLLVPVVAVPAERSSSIGPGDDPGTGHSSDGSDGSDMAAITLVAPDGAKALPAFTSLGALAGWDAAARPVPVSAQRAALAAVQEGCESIVLDVGTDTSYALRSSMVWALATARAWLPAHLDSQVDAAVAAAVAAEPVATAYTLGAGASGALRVTLTLHSGLRSEDVRALVTRIGERVATDGEVRARIDALNFTLQEA